MTLPEFYWLYELKRPRNETDYAGGLTEKDCQELYEMLG
jgi:hypothetical protein